MLPVLLAVIGGLAWYGVLAVVLCWFVWLAVDNGPLLYATFVAIRHAKPEDRSKVAYRIAREYLNRPRGWFRWWPRQRPGQPPLPPAEPPDDDPTSAPAT